MASSMAEQQSNGFRTAEIITIVLAIITAVIGVLQIFPNWRFWETSQPVLPVRHQEPRPFIVVNCVGRLDFQDPEYEVDLEQGSSSTPGQRRSRGRGVTEG
ncbi:hypothetical protein L873DRAFT_1810227 [Choiromyces venosus 120613-1]|uniref:Uncharacterized protein n=1 Tax=Choiromyces venosus 120613-1 TaxID=1336337 RepID=A0A3N4JJK7_9PEZI|nr:hypothetical protein L873DRAFT_1810227 [Choiromyces venosus 120613-1]